MKHIGDYYIEDNNIYAVVDTDFTREWTTCNKGTSLENTVSSKVTIPIIKKVTKENLKELLKDNEQWLNDLIKIRKKGGGIYFYEANNSAQWEARYAIEKFTEALSRINN